MKIIKFVFDTVVRGHLARLTGLILLFALSSCNKDDQELTRTFQLGLTPMPNASSQEAVSFTYEKISKDAEIINHHFDSGVPWMEALNDQPFHENIMNDWTFRKNATPTDEKIYVSVAALNSNRNGLAPYRGEEENMPLPSAWSSYHFNDEQVKTAYLNYCKRIISFFNPDCFNMNIEANTLHYVNPLAWSEFLEFHQYVYRELKSLYPDLVIFSSVTGAHMLGGFFSGNDHILQRLAVLQILEHSDVYALSFYPYLTDHQGNSYPTEAFTQLFNISNKPLAIAAAQPFTLQTTEAEAASGPAEAPLNLFMESLLNACSKRNAKFVINFVFHDYKQLKQTIGNKNDIVLGWREMGLYDASGLQRTPYTTWKHFLDRKIKEE